MSRSPGSETSRRPITPPNLPERWFDARREERLVRWLKRGLVALLVAAALALALNWWIVEAFLMGRGRAVAEACLDSPFASGSVTAAGGPDAITEPDADALAPYRGDPEGRDAAALRIRDRASLLGDRSFATAAAAVTMGGPFETRVEIARIEAGCRRHLEAEGLAAG